jgi:hypothetical protein
MSSFCRNCFFDDLEEEKIKRNIEEYVESLSPEIKSDEELLKARLALCEECPDFLGGMCRVCGCFVMARAAKKLSYCPAVKKRW